MCSPSERGEFASVPASPFQDVWLNGAELNVPATFEPFEKAFNERVQN
jgi:hypothetical protein